MNKKPHLVSEHILKEFCDFTTDLMGLYFPYDSWADLEKKLQVMASALNFDDISECLKWIMKTSSQQEKINILSHFLTIGETYFFRDAPLFKLLKEKILLSLISSRRHSSRHLRIWSAACCTGEEPYSIAILLHQMIPNLHEWEITIIGSDINPYFLHKAEKGEYKEWSFRATSKEIRNTYFNKKSEGLYKIHPEIKKLVTFTQINLVKDPPALFLQENSQMDIILCNNVLIYFSPYQINKVVKQLASHLAEKGYLIVSAIEVPYIKDSLLTTFKYHNATYFQKLPSAKITPSKDLDDQPSFIPYSINSNKHLLSTPQEPVSSIQVDLPAFINPAQAILHFDFNTPPIKQPETLRPVHPTLNAKNGVKTDETEQQKEILHLYQAGHYIKVIALLENKFANQLLTYEEFFLLIKAYLYNQQVQLALDTCQNLLAQDKLDPLLYYLQGLALQEMNHLDEAIHAFKRTLYLDSNFVMAYFHLGNLMLARHKHKEASRYFRNVLDLIKNNQPNDLVKGDDVLLTQRLKEIVLGILNQ